MMLISEPIILFLMRAALAYKPEYDEVPDATHATVSQLDRKVDRIGTRLTVLKLYRTQNMTHFPSTAAEVPGQARIATNALAMLRRESQGLARGAAPHNLACTESAMRYYRTTPIASVNPAT